jgi:hypothetical protein
VDQNELRDWLLNEILPDEYRPVYLEKESMHVCRNSTVNHLEGREASVVSALHRYEKIFFAQTVERLSPKSGQAARSHPPHRRPG